MRLLGGGGDEAPHVSKYTRLDDDLHAYLVAHSDRQDPVLARVQAETEAMGDISRMQVAPDQGAFMTVLTRAVGAREALEVGTFTGYSAISIARGLGEGGRLICCELSEEYAETAAANIEAAGVGERVEIRVGPALETLRAMPERELFDIAFIDADKVSYPAYYEEALLRLRSGGLMLLDNVLMGGAVLSPTDHGDGPKAMAKLNAELVDDERVDVAMTAIADGITMLRKR
ncbi:O-methyltransferase [soil metagenome]